MRYKHPEATTSKELAAAADGRGDRAVSEDFRFASAVAAFGLVLRDSQYKGNANSTPCIERASGAIGYDPNGHRKEFVEMVRKAKGLTERAKE